MIRTDHRLLDPAWSDVASLSEPGPGRSRRGSDDLGHYGSFEHSLIHLPAEVYLTALVMGGVLGRHPSLWCLVSEMGASWVGNWVERMEHTCNLPRFRWLPEPPSHYVRRQVRVTPMYGESVSGYIARDGLTEVYAFGSDYPHPEGGRAPVDRFLDELSPLGDEVIERFFVSNVGDRAGST